MRSTRKRPRLFRFGEQTTRFAHLLFRSRRPERPELAACALFWITTAILVAALLVTHARTRKRFDAVFRPALGLQASLLLAERDITYVRLAERVEARLRVMSALLSQALEPPPDSVKPLAATKAAVPAFADAELSKALDVWPEAYSSAGEPVVLRQNPCFGGVHVADAGHYALPGQFLKAPAAEGYLIPQAQIVFGQGTDGLRMARELSAILRQHFKSFPEAPASDTLKTPDAPDDGDSVELKPSCGLAAFLYCAIPPPRGTLSAAAESTLAQAIRANQVRQRRRDPGHQLSGALITTAKPERANALQRPLMYVGYPAAPLPPHYYAGMRPWASALVMDKAVWTAQYGEVGTQIPVITCAEKLRDVRGVPVGVVAADLHAASLAQLERPMFPHLLNLGFLWLALLGLWAVLYASAMWRHFRLIFWAVAALYGWYWVTTLAWLIQPKHILARELVEHLQIGMSVLNSVLFLVSGAFTFDQLDRPRGAVDEWLHGVERFLGRRTVMRPVLTAVVTSVVVAVLTVFGNNVLAKDRPLIGEFTPSDLVDAILSFVALVVFGVRFAAWITRTWPRMENLKVVGVTGLFLAYAVGQVLYPVLRTSELYFRWLFVGKVVLITGILLVVYLYTEVRNGWRRQFGRITNRVLSGVAAGNAILVCAKETPEEWPVLFVNSAGGALLGLQGSAASSGRRRGEDKRPESRSAVVESVFGEGGLFEPTDDLAFPEVLVKPSAGELRDALAGAPREGELRVLRKLEVELRRRDGEIVRAELLVAAMWIDRYVLSAGMATQRYYLLHGVSDPPARRL